MTSSRQSAAQKKGIKYEKEIHNKLEERFRDNYVPSPWIEYLVDNFVGVCQPDGLLVWPESGEIDVLEIKHSHDPRAWFQLWGLYVPVLKSIFGEELWKFRGTEICRYYDPDTEFPGEVSWREDLLDLREGLTNLVVWNEKRDKPLKPEKS